MTRMVLIINSDADDRHALGEILSEQYSVLEFAGGEEANTVIRRRRRELAAVVMDMTVPDLNGLVILQQLRARHRAGNLPAIIVTGPDTEEAELQALQWGAMDFLSRPYCPGVLLARVKNTISLWETAARVNRMERDRLTGLYNLEGFCTQLEQLPQASEQPLDIVVMDIGNFKLVNDLYGEMAGDEVIRSVARSAEHSFGDRAILAHRTADQFLMAFPGGVDGQWLWKESQTWDFPLDMVLPFRFGIYRPQKTEEPVSVMCDNAKLAADSIHGRCDVHSARYDTGMRSRLVSDQALTADLEKGIQSGQFEAWYQPKCDPATGRVVGAEALVRWNHPEKGTLSPDQFVPLFERNRLITRLDRFMWERTCRDLADWRARGVPMVPVSVNVSRVDVYQRDLVRRLSMLVRKLDLEPAMMPLEITESAYAADPSLLLATISRLRKQGFLVEMDDFGSGWSSLNGLMELALDGVKLDIRFLRDFPKSRSGNRFLSHLLEMFSDLGLPVTAEGVENARQAAFLAEHGCRTAQGMYFAPPLSKEDFESFLWEHQ